jgi:hypothetical protein
MSAAPQDMPGFGLAIRFGIDTLGGLVVGVEVNRQHVRRVQKLQQERKMWSAPSSADEFIWEIHDQIMQGTIG